MIARTTRFGVRFLISVVVFAAFGSLAPTASAQEARKLHALIAVDYRCQPPLPGQNANDENFTGMLKMLTNHEGEPLVGHQVSRDRVVVKKIGAAGLSPGLIKSSLT